MTMKKICRDARKKRKVRIRKKVRGSQERPRMSVFRSSKHIYVQIVDDTTGSVLTSASSLSPEFREGSGKGSVVESAKKIGAMVAEKALAKDIRQVVFDRNGYLYHGRVKALAEGAREKGLTSKPITESSRNTKWHGNVENGRIARMTAIRTASSSIVWCTSTASPRW